MDMSLQPDLFHGVFQYLNDRLMGDEEDVGMLREEEFKAKEQSFYDEVQEQRRNVVGLKRFLHQCAQVSSGDNAAAKEIINRIFQQSSPHGDATE
ncbi:hypothetical protein AgCh_002460 [Apium graveolens]